MRPKNLAYVVAIFVVMDTQILFAEDALTSLQRDVEMAKQKNQIMFSQVNSARTSLDQFEKKKFVPTKIATTTPRRLALAGPISAIILSCAAPETSGNSRQAVSMMTA